MASAKPVVIVGAGISGLLCAQRLRETGIPSILLDKGQSPGGRLATRRIGNATFDHGAQFFTVRTPQFRTLVDDWQRAGLVFEWCRGFASPLDFESEPTLPEADGHSRYAVRWGMNALAKHLALGASIRTSVRVLAASPAADDDGFTLTIAGESRSANAAEVNLSDTWTLDASALVITTPTPQSAAICATGNLGLSERTLEALASVGYDPAICVMLVLDSETQLPEPGAIQMATFAPDYPVAFVADNYAKGVSTSPAITIHASTAWSREHFDADEELIAAQLIEHAAHWLGGAKVVDYQVKRWRYASPNPVWHEPALIEHHRAGIVVFAGDAFGGPRIEGAALSGLAAANILHHLRV